MSQSFTLAVFTKNRVNPAYDAARLATDRVAAEAGATRAVLRRGEQTSARPSP